MNAPPLLVSFDSIDVLLEALPKPIKEAQEEEIRALVNLGLPPAVSTITLSTLFGVSTDFISAMSHVPYRYYRSFKIRKGKGKKTRQIDAPVISLKIIQRWLGFHIAIAATSILPDCVCGFVPRKHGVIEAAKIHCQSQWVFSLDLRDFFSNITASQVMDACISLGYSERASRLITKLCTLNQRLPQGSPASPVLSNLVFLPTDRLLQSLAESLQIRYSRYADDLVFSGISAPPNDMKGQVMNVLLQKGWQIAEEKEYLAILPKRLKVHGLLVHGVNPRLTKGYRNKIRAYRHLLQAEKISPNDLNSINGHIAYAELVENSVNGLES